jgi:hypothetical protein
MKLWQKMITLFSNNDKGSTPLLIIKKEAGNSDVKEYSSIEEAIADLEKDPNVPAVKIEKIKASLQKLKNNSAIKIKNGELVK